MDPNQYIGLQIDQYVIEEHIARGGMADVFLARDITLDRQVAFKILLSGLAQDPQFKDRFRREAQVVARLNHPNIVQVYNTGLTPFGQSYIAMQYVPGGSLADLLGRWEAEGKVAPASQSLAVIRHMASALTVAHREGIVHRDLKPSNVLIRPDGTPVLVDLGIASIEGGEKLTQTGAIIGTPHYMSPEQVKGIKVDGRSDIYSLGVILYEMLAGIRPFEADQSIAVLHKQVYEAPTPIEHLRSGLSLATQQVVETSLQKEPDLRYRTANELVEAIDRALLAEGDQGYLLKTTILLPEGQAELLSKSRIRPGSLPPQPPPAGPTYIEGPQQKGSSNIFKTIGGIVVLLLLFSAGIYLGTVIFGNGGNSGLTPVATAIVFEPTEIVDPVVVPATEVIPTESIPTDEAPTVVVPTVPIATEAISTDVPPPTDVPATDTPVPTNTPVPTDTPVPTPTPDRGPEYFSIGRSANGHSLEIVRFGDGPNDILFVGGIHAGNSPGTVSVARMAIDHFSGNLDEVPENTTLYIMENFNPDSPNAVGKISGRLNGNGVDLNRNWDCAWSRNPDVLGTTLTGGGGTAPLSEPEARSLADFIMDNDPVAVLFWGAQGGVAAPGECGGTIHVSRQLASTFADAAGYRYFDGGVVQGDVSNWLDREGIPAIFSLLTDRSSADWNNNLAGMRAILRSYGN